MPPASKIWYPSSGAKKTNISMFATTADVKINLVNAQRYGHHVGIFEMIRHMVNISWIFLIYDIATLKQKLGKKMKLPAYEFSEYVEKKIEALPADTMRSKNTPEAKKLIEELRALSRLALALKCPGVEVDVEVTPDGSEADGIIFEKGFRDRELKIQIAYGFDHEEAMRMELMNKQGHVPGAGPIRRDKKTKEISAELVAVNSDEYIQRCTQEIKRLYEKKMAKNYKTKMVLLIGFFEFKLKGLPSWSRLYENLLSELHLEKSSFIAVYLFNEASNELYQVA